MGKKCIHIQGQMLVNACLVMQQHKDRALFLIQIKRTTYLLLLNGNITCCWCDLFSGVFIVYWLSIIFVNMFRSSPWLQQIIRQWRQKKGDLHTTSSIPFIGGGIEIIIILSLFRSQTLATITSNPTWFIISILEDVEGLSKRHSIEAWTKQPLHVPAPFATMARKSS